MKNNKYLEIIATNVEDVKTLNKFSKDIDSIELCVDLDKGGFSPNHQMLEELNKIKQNIPVHLMIRNNETDIADEKEFDKLIKLLKSLDQYQYIEGIVVGFLINDAKNSKIIDFARLKTIIKYGKEKNLIFHRAFDQIDPKTTEVNLFELKALGFNTVLTSGGSKKITENIHVLKTYQEVGISRILCGGGINFDNINAFLNNKLFNIHIGSCVREDNSFHKPLSEEKIASFIEIMQQ